MNGTINIESEVNHGTRFSFNVPFQPYTGQTNISSEFHKDINYTERLKQYQYLPRNIEKLIYLGLL